MVVKNTQPVSGALEAILKIRKAHELYVITSSANFVCMTKPKCGLTGISHGIFQSFEVTNHPQWALSGKTRTKIEVCRSLKVDLLIEDSLIYAKECDEDNIPVLLFNYPWNQGVLPRNTKRVQTWIEAVG